MLKTIRRTIAAIFFALVTLLFLDFTGCAHKWLGWMAEVQLIPALLAHSVAILLGIAILTLLFGRIYCSIICPLGVFQDVVARVGRRGKKLPYNYSPAKKILRYSVLGVMIIAPIIGISVILSLLDPYAAYGRIANNLFQPLWQFGNNILAFMAEKVDSYAFYSSEVWIKSGATFAVAVITFVALAVLAWRGGRTYCNTVCPVGTLLGFISKCSIFRISIDKNKCNKCSLCARNCKASCIDYTTYRVDNSRCVSCFNCLDKCSKDAISYSKVTKNGIGEKAAEDATPKSDGRREFIATAVALTAAVAKAQVLPKQVEMKVDGGLTDIDYIKPSVRETAITPPGSLGARYLKKHCTACQLCVSACPNGVLRPSSKFDNFMQPEMSFVRGYCRPECVECGKVCPSNAIRPFDEAEKTSIKIGSAKWIEKNCIVTTKGDPCNRCNLSCPTKAISKIKIDKYEHPIPVIDIEKCIGCGACENLCPARPYSAIYVEGNTMHRNI